MIKAQNIKKVAKSREGVSLVSLEGNWCDMQSNQDTIDISNEKDSLLIPVAIEDKVTSMNVGSSTKGKAHKPSSPVPQKRRTRMTTRAHGEGTPQMGPSSLEVMDFAARARCISGTSLATSLLVGLVRRPGIP